jgi:hypothetical protein
LERIAQMASLEATAKGLSGALCLMMGLRETREGNRRMDMAAPRIKTAKVYHAELLMSR